jgi:hypothetical protein
MAPSRPLFANARSGQNVAAHAVRSSFELGGALHLATVFKRTLARTSTLSEGSSTTEGTSRGIVVHTDDADVVSATNTAFAGHALGHLDGDRVLAHLRAVSMIALQEVLDGR